MIYDRGAPVFPMHGTGFDNRLEDGPCKRLLPLKVPKLRVQTRDDGRCGEFISHGYLQPVGPINTNLMLSNIVTINEYRRSKSIRGFMSAACGIILKPMTCSAYLTNIASLFRGGSLFTSVQLLR